MKRLLSTTAIVVGALIFAGPHAKAATISLTDSWNDSTPYAPDHVTGALPTLSLAGQSVSNFPYYVTPKTDSYTQTLTIGQSTPKSGATGTEYLFVAQPGSTNGGVNVHTAAIPIDLTLTDSTGGTKTVTLWMNYYAKFSNQQDDMAWSLTEPNSPGQLSSGSLSDSITLSDGAVVMVTLPWETDWNMAQEIDFDVTAGPTLAAPEPSTIALLGLGLLGTVALAKRKRG